MQREEEEIGLFVPIGCTNRPRNHPVTWILKVIIVIVFKKKEEREKTTFTRNLKWASAFGNERKVSRRIMNEVVHCRTRMGLESGMFTKSVESSSEEDSCVTSVEKF